MGPGRTVKRARALRRSLSLPEGLLWQQLRQRPAGFKFRRQHPAGDYILDFYCVAIQLAVEVDGATHEDPRAMSHDIARTHWLASQGVIVLRVPASAVLKDVAGVVDHIIHSARSLLPLHQPTAGPPPRSGEE